MMRMLKLGSCLLATAIALAVSVYNSLPTAQTIRPYTDPSKLMPDTVIVRPMRLVISSIKVNAFIEPVGVLPNGDLATPKGKPWNEVGWYKSGTVQGGRGSDVIDVQFDRRW